MFGAGGFGVRWVRRQSLIACVGLAAVVGAAYAGRAHLYGLIGLVSLAAVALSFAAVFQRRPAERIAGIALLAWVVLATLTEQFAWAADDGGVFVAAAWLLPPVAGGAALPAAGHWWSGLGCLGGRVRRLGCSSGG